MPFQSAVRFQLTEGFAGQLVGDVPQLLDTYRINGQTVLPNVFGYAFTYVTTEVAGINGAEAIQTVVVGDAGAGSAGFAGILAVPEEHALYGTTAGALEPTLELPAYSRASFCRKGRIVVRMPVAVNAGDPVYYVEADGSLHNAAAAGRVLIANAEVKRTIGAAGLTIIDLM